MVLVYLLLLTWCWRRRSYIAGQMWISPLPSSHSAAIYWLYMKTVTCKHCFVAVCRFAGNGPHDVT